MKILLTGGSGDLSTVVSYQLQKRGDICLRLDIRKPMDSYGQYIEGSILDRAKLAEIFPQVDCIVHVAAWHGYHEVTKKKHAYDFWDLNVTGTFNIFQTALETNIKKIILISSESVADTNGIYGWTKILAEEIAQRFADNHDFNILTLRPRAFAPHWNQEMYSSFVEWMQWYWKGAVHINDAAKAVIQGIDLLNKTTLNHHLVLPIDGAYEYTESDLLNWDQQGPGTTFKKYYADYYQLAIQYGLDPTAKPSQQNMSVTQSWLGYTPTYSLKNALDELAKYGHAGPAFTLE